jgi:hypothetical protein
MWGVQPEETRAKEGKEKEIGKDTTRIQFKSK